MRVLHTRSIGEVDVVGDAAVETFDVVAKAGALGVAGFDSGLFLCLMYCLSPRQIDEVIGQRARCLGCCCLGWPRCFHFRSPLFCP